MMNFTKFHIHKSKRLLLISLFKCSTSLKSWMIKHFSTLYSKNMLLFCLIKKKDNDRKKRNSTLYHNPDSSDPKEKAFENHCGKKRKWLKLAFSPFPTIFSTHSKRIFNLLVILIFSSANSFSCKSIILSCAKELKRIWS